MKVIHVILLGLLLCSMNPVEAATVRLNEILANNATLTEIDGSTPDWVELYNSSSQPLDLGGWMFSSRGRTWVFPQGLAIGGQGFLVVYFNPDIPIGSRNTGFGLSTDGDDLSLYDASTNLVDSVVFGMQVPDYSIGRVGEPALWKLNQPTRGLANTAAQMGNASTLIVNEWMANPTSGDDWFELYNPALQPVDLSGLYLTDDLAKPTTFRIAPLCFIGTGESAFTQFFASGTTNKGPNHVSFKLSNAGESIGLYASASSRINSVTFFAQQVGVSEGRLPDGAATITKFPTTLTPGESNYLPLTNVWINEILAHADPPFEDAIELFNPTDRSTNIGGWFLSDSAADFQKYRIPAGTVISAGGYRVFYEYQFNSTNANKPFNLNSAEGDRVYLSAADAAGKPNGYRAFIKFGPTLNGMSLGRYPTSQGVDYPPLQRATFGNDQPATLEEFRQGAGASNAPPLIGPLVINEVMYHPPETQPGVDNTQDEFIEILNFSVQPAPLYDPDYPTNTWRIRGGVSFNFPQNVILGAGKLLILVKFDPENEEDLADAFRAKYQVPASVPLLGPYEGKLSNAEDEVRLEQPDSTQGQGHANAGLVPYVTMDLVHYTDSIPWPAGADGAGFSLQRRPSKGFGNEPRNWVAEAPTAGRPNGGASLDSDQDGMLNDWEIQYGLDPNNPNDAGLDPDQDGLTNLQEFLCGCDPHDPTSVLRIESIVKSGETTLLTFTAVIGRSYTVEYRNDVIHTNGWSSLTNLSAGSSTKSLTVNDSQTTGTAARFYRLVTPAP
jgi:hypothetical protein